MSCVKKKKKKKLNVIWENVYLAQRQLEEKD